MSFETGISPPYTFQTQATRSPKHNKEEVSNKPDDNPFNSRIQTNEKVKVKFYFEAVSDESADKARWQSKSLSILTPKM
jgi:hypothetical protein